MRLFWLNVWFVLVVSSTVFAKATPPLPENIQSFINTMVKEDGFDKKTLQQLFQNVTKNESILTRMSTPSEKLPWYQYKRLFNDEARLKEGMSFWQAHRAELARAEKEYQVPAELIVAILGVETHYGKSTGKFGVLEALSTLAFYYPPRADFFKQELREYLLLSREEGFDPLAMKGSYAGAMGQGQFIPSSYRKYAVDFDKDGKRDLFNTTDAIGSVANYFHQYGWQWNEPIAAHATLNRHRVNTFNLQAPSELRSAELIYPLKKLLAAGVRPNMKTKNHEEKQVALMAFENENDSEYWLCFHNFSVITKYNKSPHYAMAVYQLSEKLKQQNLRVAEK